jgi:hypothetical protein
MSFVYNYQIGAAGGECRFSVKLQRQRGRPTAGTRKKFDLISPARELRSRAWEETMARLLRSLAVISVAIVAAITPALGDATETVDPKSAAEFVLSVCLPAMDDVTNVERMAQENNWPHVTPRSKWRANGFFIATWVWNDGSLPNCFVGLRPYKKVDRDGFLDAIFASLKLKLISDDTLQQRFRQETYEIIGERPLKLLFGSDNNDGTVSSAGVYMDEQAH